MTKLVIIGAGPAGRFASMYGAEHGMDVTLIEKSHIAGKCLNQACMVVCALNEVARHIDDSQNMNDLGIIQSDVKIDYPKICEKIRETQKKIRKISEKETTSCGVEYVHGTAVVDAENMRVIVNDDDEYEYDKLLVCTGSSPFIPNIKGIENAFTYKDILKLKEVPEDLIIIGGGSTAAEYAHIFSSFGSNVNILCRSQFLKMLDDTEAEEYITSNLLKNTVVHENVEILEITPTSVITNTGEIKGKVFNATGVVPNSEILDGIVDININKAIEVDKHLKTSDENIYAAGDVIGGIQSTPVSRMEAITAVRNMLGEDVVPDYSMVPMTISLGYDVSYLLGYDVSNIGKHSRTPGAPGPGSFWYTLSGKVGFTKEVVDNDNLISNILSISPSSNVAISYMVKATKDKQTVNDFENFIEIHPTSDVIEKLAEYFSRYE